MKISKFELVVLGVVSLLFLVVSVVSSVVGLSGSLLVMNENQILYLYSSSPQILAGVYGLTFAGFVFFRGELDREVGADSTLIEVVGILKFRCFWMLLIITAVVGVAVLLSNLVIAYEGGGDLGLLSILMNVGQSAFVVSLFVIGYFIYYVVHPKRIELISKELQHIADPGKIGEGSLLGDLSEFVRAYNSIENMMQKYGRDSELILDTDASRGMDKPGRRFVSNPRLADMLNLNGMIDGVLCKRIKNLITLRNSILHGADPVVSVELVKEAQDVHSKLEKILVG